MDLISLMKVKIFKSTSVIDLHVNEKSISLHQFSLLRNEEHLVGGFTCGAIYIDLGIIEKNSIEVELTPGERSRVE